MTSPSRRRFAPTPAAEPAIIEKALVLTPAQEPVALRLAGALVLQWDALPDALQDLLIDQAAIGLENDDERFSPVLIENFIRRAKTTSVKPKPKPAETQA